MSKATKRKHVTKEVLEDFYVPEKGEEIVKIIRGCGNNLHEVEGVGGSKYLASMPTKFRRNVWVKRGDFVVVTPIEEGNKVKGEICYILYSKQIKCLKKEKLWPDYFDDTELYQNKHGNESSSKETSNNNSYEDVGDDQEQREHSSSEDEELFKNPNHRPVYVFEGSEEEQSDVSDDSDDSVRDEEKKKFTKEKEKDDDDEDNKLCSDLEKAQLNGTAALTTTTGSLNHSEVVRS